MLFALPPVRGIVSLRRDDSVDLSNALAELFAGREVHLYQSGTAALAVALMDAKSRHNSTAPEAILPAYGCPQLVAACLHAGVRPRIVDTAPECWGYDLAQLQSALSADTVAVVAVNLLGVGDQAAQILPLARGNGSFLIQDSAQHLPVGAVDWPGDYIVLSFGRGKPLNMLRGGALAVPRQRPLLVEATCEQGLAARLEATAMGSRAAGILFNTLTHPGLYGVVSRLPGLGLGATRYQSFERAVRLAPTVWGQLGPAYQAYSHERWESPWAAVDWQQLEIVRLTCIPGSAPCEGRCLRLALLASDRARRDRIVETLNRRCGAGASNMYGVPMSLIEAIPSEVSSQGPFPNATRLAERLFTLPTHSAVSAGVVQRSVDCLRALLA